jgi:PDZ domain-containing protein
MRTRVGGRARQRVTAGAGVAALVVAVFALNFYRLPVVALTPGPAEDVLTHIKVRGSTPVYDSKGKLYLTSVGIDDDVRFYEALLDLANRDVELRQRAELFPKGDSSEEIDRENVELMDQSKTVALVVALRELGYRVEPSAVLVGNVVRGAPADGKLEAGDRILQVDGHAVATIDQVRAAITRHHVGERVAFKVSRDLAATTVAVPVAADDGQPRVGVELRERFDDLPVEVTIETENIGGPSAGLMFALSIIDRLTPDDLTRGRRIAGTGEISVDREVLPIGGAAEKLIAARRQGATAFLIPSDNCADVRGRVPSGLRLVRVATLDDALRFLRQPNAPADGC